MQISSSDLSLLMPFVIAQGIDTVSNRLMYDPVSQELDVPDAVASSIQAILDDPDWRSKSAVNTLVAYAASARYAKETGGITVSGVAMPTDRATQAQLAGAYSYVQTNQSATVMWKLAGGSFVSLDAAAITGIATAVAAHVQACFAAEASVVAGIKASPPTVSTTAAIDAAFAAVVT